MKYVLRACLCRNGTEKYVEELIRACKTADIDEVMLCEDNIFISAISQPLSAHREMADIMKGAVKTFKENGIACSFYLKSLIGHFTCNVFSLPYTKFVGLNGEESANECCLLDDGFREYAAELLSYYAECGFTAMMIDDDFRSINHCNGQIGCFCSLHLEKTSALYGEELTRERLISAITSYDQDSLRIKECFRKANFEGQKKFAEAIEKAVHKVDKTISLGLMCSGIEADMFQGRDMRLLLETFAGEGGKPYLRPAGGYYTDTLGDALFMGYFMGLKYKEYVGLDANYISEVDVYSPRNIFTKSAKLLDAQITMHAATGFNSCSLNIFDHFGTSPFESIEYLETLKKNKKKYERIENAVKDKIPYGVSFPVEKEYVEKLSSDSFGVLGGNNYDFTLWGLGIPVCYSKTDVVFLTGELLNCYDDEEVKGFLQKGVILDRTAIKELGKRGFAEDIGVRIEGYIDFPTYEVFSNEKYYGEYVGNKFPVYTANVHADEQVLRLTSEKGATVLTEICDAQLRRISPATILYENKYGGKVLSLAANFNRGNWYYKGRVRALWKIMNEMFGDKLPYRIENTYSVASIYYKGRNNDTLLLYNYGYDDQKVDLYYEKKEKEIFIKGLEFKLIKL